MSAIASAASRNLAKTYFALGATLPGAEIRREEGYTLCSGDLPHPLCNFAAELDLNPWAVRRLHERSLERPVLYTYLCPGDRPEHADELLLRAGFRERYAMPMMAAEALSGDCQLDEATDPAERAEVARFMAEIFFARQTKAVREEIARATAEGEGLRLFGHRIGKLLTAAAMVCESPGAVGLYNLCVTPAQRGRGHAGRIVAEVRRLAGQSGASVTLQCEPRLVPLYEGLGFREIGTVRVFEPIRG